MAIHSYYFTTPFEEAKYAVTVDLKEASMVSLKMLLRRTHGTGVSGTTEL